MRRIVDPRIFIPTKTTQHALSGFGTPVPSSPEPGPSDARQANDEPPPDKGGDVRGAVAKMQAV